MPSSRTPELLHALRDHATDKADIAGWIALVFATMFAPKGWQIKNERGGPESWVIYYDVPGKRYKEWRFTNGGKGTVIVRNAFLWRQAKDRRYLRTRVQVIKWAREALA